MEDEPLRVGRERHDADEPAKPATLSELTNRQLDLVLSLCPLNERLEALFARLEGNPTEVIEAPKHSASGHLQAIDQSNDILASEIDRMSSAIQNLEGHL